MRGLESGRIAARAAVSAVTAGTVSEITGGKFANGAMTAAFVALVSSAAQVARGNAEINAHQRAVEARRKALLESLGPDKIGRIEFLEKQNVFRGVGDPIILEKVADDCSTGICIDYEPPGYAGAVDDLGLHSGYQQRLPSLSHPGSFHLTVQDHDIFGAGIYVHYDAIDPMSGPLSTLSHGIREVLPSLLYIKPIYRNDYQNYGE